MLGAVRWSLIFALRWSAPAECPQVDALKARLAATVGTSLASSADAVATVTREADGRYAATLAVPGPDRNVGLRTLEESTCDVLADAVVTVLALSLGPPAAPPPRSPPPVPPTVKTPDAPVATPPATPDPRFAAGLLVAVDRGTLPSTAIGGGAQLAWYPLRSLRVEGSFLRWLGQSAAVSGASFGGSFRLTSGTLRSCWSPLGTTLTLTLAPCVAIDLDHVDASGYGSSHVEDGSATWWAPSIGALVRWQPLHLLAFTALADVAFPVSRRSFVIEDGGAIY